MAIDFAKLVAPTWIPVLIAGETFEVGCIPLGPGDFADHADTLANLIAAGVASAIREKVQADTPAPEPEEVPALSTDEAIDQIEDQVKRVLQGRKLSAGERESLKVITCLTVRQIRPVGGEAQPCRFVMAENAEDPARGRLHINRLPLPSVEAVASHGIQYAMDAARRAAGFRQRRRAADGDVGRDGASVQPEAGEPAAAA